MSQSLQSNTKRQHRTYAPETRETAIINVLEKQMSIKATAAMLRVNPSTVSTWISKFEDGTDKPVERRSGQRKLQDEHKEALLAFVDDHASATLDEFVQHLRDNFNGFKPAKSTVDRFFREEANVTLKRVKLTAPASDASNPMRLQQRREWVEHLRSTPALSSPHEWIYIEESGFNLHQTRRVARSQRGRRSITTAASSSRGPNVTLIVAVDRTGVRYHSYNHGGTTREIFVKFLEGLFQAIGSTPPRVLLMDDASIHKSVDVTQLVNGVNHMVLFNTPYTPQFNAAAQVFSKVEGRVGKSTSTTNDANALLSTIDGSLAAVQPEDVQGWVSECMRWHDVAMMNFPVGEHHNAADALAAAQALASNATGSQQQQQPAPVTPCPVRRSERRARSRA